MKIGDTSKLWRMKIIRFLTLVILKSKKALKYCQKGEVWLQYACVHQSINGYASHCCVLYSMRVLYTFLFLFFIWPNLNSHCLKVETVWLYLSIKTIRKWVIGAPWPNYIFIYTYKHICGPFLCVHI